MNCEKSNINPIGLRAIMFTIQEERNMKKYFAAVLAGTMALTLGACGSSSAAASRLCHFLIQN